MISCSDFLLEARYEEGNVPCSAVLCHPHPLYGGEMNNNVVLALRDTLRTFGWGTLRFNFRGVGRSGGEYGHGDREAEDVIAVCAHLQKSGNTSVHLIGYSFGARVALKATGIGVQPRSLILVSPPIDFLDFDTLQLPPIPCLILLGEQDEFCRAESLKEWVENRIASRQDVEVRLLPRCNHFYWGKEAVLSAEVSDFIRKKLPPCDA